MRWILFLITGAAAAWFLGVQFRSHYPLVYASTSPVAFTAHLVSRSYNESGTETHSSTLILAQRGDGSQVLLRTSIDGKPVGTKRITDTASATMTTVDPLTQSRATYKMGSDEVSRYRSPKASCDVEPTMKAVSSSGEKLLGWDVVHYAGVLPGENLPAERWLAPGLNCLALKEVVRSAPYRNVQAVENLTLGEPDPSLFAIPEWFVERKPSEILSRAEQQGGSKPNARTKEVLDKVYESRQNKP